MAVNSGVRLAKKPATAGPARATPAPQARNAISAGPTAMKSSAATTGPLHAIWPLPSAHSPAANRPDQNRPKTTCAIRKADQSARIAFGSLVGCASIQLYQAQPTDASST